MPLFDVEIGAEKQSPYSRLSQNEMAMQFYTAGLFDPARWDQAVGALNMMDFDGKNTVLQYIRENGGRYAAQQAASPARLENQNELRARMAAANGASPV